MAEHPYPNSWTQVRHPPVHALNTLDNTKYRRFSGTVWTNKTHLLTGMDGQVGAIKYYLGSKLLSNSLQPQHRGNYK